MKGMDSDSEFWDHAKLLACYSSEEAEALRTNTIVPTGSFDTIKKAMSSQCD